MGWLSFCAVALLAAVNVRVTTVEGDTINGPLRALGAAGVEVGGDPSAAAEHSFALDQVLSIERLERPAAAAAGPQVAIAGGSRLAIAAVTTEGTTAELQIRNQPPLAVPLKQLRWIRFGSPAAAIDPQWLGLVDRPRVADSLVVRRPGDAIDEVSGIVLSIDAETVAFDLEGETLNAPLTRLEGLLFASTAEQIAASPGNVTVEDIDGSRWVALSLGAGSDSEVELNLGNGLVHRLPLSRIAKAELSGSVEFLAAQPPVQTLHTPYVSLGLPTELVQAWLGPERVGDRDLVMRAPSHAEFRVAAGSQTLAGSVQFDSDVAGGGDCVVRVLLDGEVAWEQTLSVSAPAPRGFELPLGDARRVRLEVLTGDDGDFGDTVRIHQPRMTK